MRQTLQNNVLQKHCDLRNMQNINKIHPNLRHNSTAKTQRKMFGKNLRIT